MVTQTNLSAWEYNKQAQEQWRTDWKTAYRKDVLWLNDNIQDVNTTIPTQTMQSTQIENVSTPKTWDITTDNTSQWINTQQQKQDLSNVQKQAETTQTPQNTVETPEIKPTTTEIPKTTETKQTITPEVNQLLQWQEAIDLYKKRGSNLSDLENLIENKYPWTVATQENWWITATINWVKYQWKNNQYWDPVKTEIPTTTEQTIQPTNQDLFNILMNWWQVQDTEEWQKAQERYGIYNLYSWLTNNQLSSAIITWQLLPWTQAYEDLMKNPIQAERLNKINQENLIKWTTTNQDKAQEVKTDEILNKNTVTINWTKKTIAQAMEDWDISEQEYNDLTNTTEYTKALDDYYKKKDEADKLQANYDAVRANIEKKTKWTWILKGDLEIMIANAQEALLWPLNLAITLSNNALGKSTQLKNNATALFDINYKNYKDQQTRAQQLADTESERAYNEQQAVKTAEQQAKQTAQEFANQKELLQIQQDYKDKAIETSLIDLWTKRALINNKTWETIASYDIWQTPTTTESWTKLDDNTLYNQVTWEIQKVWATSWSIDKQTATTKYWTTPAVRNFNPGNITDTAFWWQKVSWERFTVFNTPQEWFNALVSKIENIQAWNSKVYSPDMTLLQYISKYAPASDNNNPTAYANSIAKDLWVTTSTKIKDLDATKLASAHAKHEDRNSYKMLQDLWIINADWTTWTPQTWVNNALLSSYREYVEDWKVPAKYVLEWLWITSEQFTNSAEKWYKEYLQNKSKEISSEYPNLNIEYTNNYASNTASQKEKLNESLTKIADVDRRISRLKELFTKYWTEVWPTDAKSEMQSLRQQITLKAKEIENLWVLNGPDMWILESLLPKTTGLMSWLFSFDKNTLTKINSLQSWYRTDAKTKWVNYWAKINFTDIPTTDTTKTTTTTTTWVNKVVNSLWNYLQWSSSISNASNYLKSLWY